MSLAGPPQGTLGSSSQLLLELPPALGAPGTPRGPQSIGFNIDCSLVFSIPIGIAFCIGSIIAFNIAFSIAFDKFPCGVAQLPALP